jgi:membrane-associated progesterone receptor component
MDVFNQFTALISTIPPVVQVLLIVLCAFIIRKLLKPREVKEDDLERERRFSLPPMKKRDFTVKDLLEFDGVKNERVLLAVCGKVFDVTKGKSFYGPGFTRFVVLIHCNLTARQ